MVVYCINWSSMVKFSVVEKYCKTCSVELLLCQNNHLYVETPHFNDVRTSSVEVFVESAPRHSQFRCSVQGYPDVSIEWHHNNLPIRDSDSKYQIVDINDNVLGPPCTANSTLMISNLMAADNGVVSCVAKTNGCDATLSRAGSCHPMIFEEQLNTTLSVFSK